MANGTLTYYACGFTTHKLSQLFQGAPSERRIFPAGVFLYTHQDGTRVLFDTGYGPATWRAGIKGFLYNLLLPARIKPDQSIAAQLRADGVDPDSITYVVLSHLHPDHIGGVRYFPGATFVLTQPMVGTMTRGKVKEGFLRRLLPDWFAAAKHKIISLEQDDPAYDLLGDGTYQLVPLPGHARGHFGALVEDRVLLAADASWGYDLMAQAPLAKPVPRAITADWVQYQHTINELLEWEAQGVRLCFSHDVYSDKDLLN